MYAPDPITKYFWPLNKIQLYKKMFLELKKWKNSQPLLLAYCTHQISFYVILLSLFFLGKYKFSQLLTIYIKT